jgi:hypothetical protein
MPTRTDHTAWDLGGITNHNGDLDRRLDVNELFLPADIRIKGTMLAWSAMLDFDAELPKQGLLDGFVRLDESKPEAILRFVQKWGPLRIQQSFKTFAQRHALGPDYDVGKVARAFFKGPFADGLGTELNEPISVYADLAKHVRGILDTAGKLSSGALSGKLAEAKYPWHCENCFHGIDAIREYEVQQLIQRMLQIGEVGFSLYWDIDRWKVEVGYPGLVGAIACQLMMAVSGSDGLYTCSGCGYPYIRSSVVTETKAGRITTRRRRRAKVGQNNYCSVCGESRAKLDAKRRYRQKIRDARGLFAAGIPPTRIAEQLDTEEENVENWIQGATDETKTRKR